MNRQALYKYYIGKIHKHQKKENMKTLKKGSDVVRKKNEEAAEMVKNGWEYCPKSLHKKNVKSGVSKVEAVPEQPSKEEKPVVSKYKKKKKDIM